MIIAYHLCYSTCVGRPAHAAAAAAVQPVKLGCTEYAAPAAALRGSAPGVDGLVVAPNGVAFVPPEVRRGVLPRLLSEILSTRIMVSPGGAARCMAAMPVVLVLVRGLRGGSPGAAVHCLPACLPSG
jgi:hypothetical protein